MTETLALQGNQIAQHRFLWDCAPGETLYQGGWGSGKTWAGARKLLILHANNNCPSLCVAPTYGDLLRVVVPELVRACEEWQWEYGNRSKDIVPHVLVGDHPIYILSAEHPERFAGFEVGAIWIDEAARIKANRNDPLRDSPTQVRSRLRHPDAMSLHMLCTTTPEGKDSWLQVDFFDTRNDSRRVYIGKSTKNRHLPEEYIQGRMDSLPPELVKQYMEGEATNYVADRAHPSFGPANIITAMSNGTPVYLGADYNVSPMCWVLCQEQSGKLVVLDELVIEDSATVDQAMALANEKGWGKHSLVRMCVDKSSKNRHTTGDPEFKVMQDEARRYGWNVAGTAWGTNPPVNARINLLSRLCQSATGDRRLMVDGRCVRLIDDMEQTARASNGYDPGRLGKRGHILDALGYVAWELKGQKTQASNLSI